MYVEITKSELTDEALTLECVDLDKALLNGWDQDFNAATVTMRFPLDQKGARVYIYRICRSSKKAADCTTMEDMVKAAFEVGTITNISANFIAHDEE